jgi:hypothetical protein
MRLRHWRAIIARGAKPWCAVLAFMSVISGACAETSVPPPFFIAHGGLFQVDLLRRDISLVGQFSSSTPCVARDPSGLFWGRVDDNKLGALDAEKGTFVAFVPLPYRVYEPIITADGRAYVCHNTLTKDGFPLSIVDLKSRKLIGRVTGILGARTDIAYGAGALFVATFGLEDRDFVRLYRIDTATDQARLVLQIPKAGFYWRVAVQAERLYLFSLPTSASSFFPGMEIRDARTMAIIPQPSVGRLFAGAMPTDKPYFFSGIAAVPCRSGDGSRCLAIADADMTTTRFLLPIRGTIREVVAADTQTVAYLYSNNEDGHGGMSLGFGDLPGRKEVKTIDILQRLASADRESGGQ